MVGYLYWFSQKILQLLRRILRSNDNAFRPYHHPNFCHLFSETNNICRIGSIIVLKVLAKLLNMFWVFFYIRFDRVSKYIDFFILRSSSNFFIIKTTKLGSRIFSTIFGSNTKVIWDPKVLPNLMRTTPNPKSWEIQCKISQISCRIKLEWQFL